MIQDLDQRFPIVDENGKATDYLLHLLRDRGNMQLDTDEALELLQTTVAGKADKTIQIIAGTGMSGGGTLAANRTLNLANTAVTPGSYTNTNLTVDAQGRITLAANGSSSGGSGDTSGKAARQTGRYYPSDNHTLGSGVAAFAAGSVNALSVRPFSKRLLISGLAVEVTTAGAAGAVIEMALYTSHPSTGMPYQLVQGSGTISVTTTGVKTFTLTTNYDVTDTVWLGHNISATHSVRVGNLTDYRGSIMGAATLGTASGSVASCFNTARTVGTAWPADLTGTAWTDNTGTSSLVVVGA